MSGILGKFAPVALTASVLLVEGCAYLPAPGPTRATVINDASSEGRLRYGYVPVNEGVIANLAKRPAARISDRFVDDGVAPAYMLGVGDAISAAIFDPNISGGSTPGNAATGIMVPAQRVGVDGIISIPYAGRFNVLNQTLASVQDAILRALAGKFADPQVVLSLTSFQSKSVTVTGAVGQPGIIPLIGKGERILDVIAAAGGGVGSPRNLSIRLIRNGESVVASFDDIVDRPADNIQVKPGDLVVLSETAPMYTAIGLTGAPGNFPIVKKDMSIIQAIGASAGINDNRATPEGVFVFRKEPKAFMQALYPDFAGLGDAEFVPVVYQLDLRRGDGLFLAQSMAVQPDDLIYVAEARSSALLKFLQIVGTTTSIALAPALIVRP